MCGFGVEKYFYERFFGTPDRAIQALLGQKTILIARIAYSVRINGGSIIYAYKFFVVKFWKKF